MAEINRQSRLEEVGIKERKTEVIRSDYSASNEYSDSHKDAISDGDPLGKGTQNGGHGWTIPDRNKPTTMIDYSNFDTTAGGGLYDIKGREGIGGREFAQRINLYNENNQYGSESVDTTENVLEGQYVVK